MRHKTIRQLKQDLQRIKATADSGSESRSLPPALLALPQSIQPKANRASKRAERDWKKKPPIADAAG